MHDVHFIGIGGVGMNGLAQLAIDAGNGVSGSDRAFNPDAFIFQCLLKKGIELFPQDGSGISERTTQVVFSTAIEKDNPDLLKAKELEIPLLHRAEFLKQLVGNDDLIAVAGTAGKTTTTGILGWIFEYIGKDPSVYNGAAVANWKNESTPGNVRTGTSGIWIIEADESDKSFLNFHPTHSIITNISKDHYELDELNSMFNQFEEQTTGITVRGQDIIGAMSSKADLASMNIPMLGKHNAENAACAFSLCMKLGFDPKKVTKAIAAFQGIERRLEIIGTVDEVTVIDDYAHNPAKIGAALSAVAEKYKRVHAFWRPHGFSPLANNMNEFIAAFATVQQTYDCFIYILPVYYAGGTVQKTVDSACFVDQLNSAGVRAQLVQDYPLLKKELKKNTTSGDAILGMGARDPELPLFAKRLVNEWKMPR